MLHKIESVPTFDAQELAIDPATVAIVTAQNFSVAYAEYVVRGTRPPQWVQMSADVLHLPRPRLITIDPAG